MDNLPPWVSSGPLQTKRPIRRYSRAWWYRIADYFFGSLAVAFYVMVALIVLGGVVALL